MGVATNCLVNNPLSSLSSCNERGRTRQFTDLMVSVLAERGISRLHFFSAVKTTTSDAVLWVNLNELWNECNGRGRTNNALGPIL